MLYFLSLINTQWSSKNIGTDRFHIYMCVYLSLHLGGSVMDLCGKYVIRTNM